MYIFKLDQGIGDIELMTKLSEMEEDEDITFVLNKTENLFQFIQRLDMNEINLSKLKIVNEIEFNFRVFLKNKNNDATICEAKTLSEVLQYIDKDEIDMYKLILATEDNDRLFISEVIQQFIYLDIDIDVMLEKEEKESNTAMLFQEHYNEIKNSVESALNNIIKIDVSEENKDDKEKIINILEEIKNNLLETEKKELSIAVMATKKSGKSVMVNCFLGNEYAPTSTELATPNSIIYRKNIENKIVLKYHDETEEFSSADDIRARLEKIYKEAEIDTELGYSIEDMKIEYRSEKEGVSNFTVIDTPGPNLAGSNHSEIAYKWIEAADVVIFVVDYSKYLTIDEEKFLRDIKKTFERYDKFYSLIVVANKIDLMYSSGEKASIIRFLDFLRFKLKELGYNGVIVFAASALQYFSAVRVPQLNGCEMLYDTEDIAGSLKKCKSKYIGKKEMSLIRFLENSFRDLEDYHGILDADLNSVKEKSGIPRLMEYTNYVTTQKAYIELLKSVLRKIDEKYAKLQNKFLSFDISQLGEKKIIKEKEKEELLEKINQVFDAIDQYSAEIEKQLNFYELKKIFSEELNSSKYELHKIIYNEIKGKIENIKAAFKNRSNEELKKIADENEDVVTPELQTNFDNVLFDMYNKKLVNYQRILNRFLNEKQNILVKIDKQIQSNIDLFNNYLVMHFKENDIKITLPKLELSISRKYFDFSKVDVKALSEIQNIIRNSLYQRHGVRGRLIQIITLNKVDMRFGKYSVDYDNIDDMVNMLLDQISNEVQTVIKEHNEKMIRYVNSYLDNELEPQIRKDINSMIENYKELFYQVRDSIKYSQLDVDKDINAIQEKINFLQSLKAELQGFFKEWQNIRTQSRKVEDKKGNRFLKLIKNNK